MTTAKTRNPASLSIAAATLVLALSYAWGAQGIIALLIAALGMLWLIGHRRRWGWTGALVFTFFVGAAAFGAWRGLPAGGMLVAMVVTLMAWDLDAFVRRLRDARRVADERALMRAHLLRFSLVAAIGLLLSGIALVGRVELGLGGALLLGLLVVLSLSRAFGTLNRQHD